MDNDWALSELRAFIDLTKLYWPPQSSSGVVFIGDNQRTTGDRDTIVVAAQIVEKILDRVLPQWRTEIKEDKKGRWQQHREAAQRAVTELERAAEIEEKLGEAGPRISASAFHPWAWEGARSLWSSGHYREAVRAAATKVNAELQNKVGRRDVSDTKLVQEAFSDLPAAQGKSRLRLPDDDGGETAKSLRVGVMQFGVGCFMAMRNPASHEVDELPEQEALEELAALSRFARWVESATVEGV